MKLWLRFLFCVVVAATASLTVHIYLSATVKPLITALTPPDFRPQHSDGYVPSVMIASYVTAFIMIAVLAFLYRQAGHLLAVANRPLKALALAAIILEAKGELIRKPVMDFTYNQSIGFPQPLHFVLLEQADIWAANILLAFCLVYLCPLKYAPQKS